VKYLNVFLSYQKLECHSPLSNLLELLLLHLVKI
jgi:hypothetical protein